MTEIDYLKCKLEDAEKAFDKLHNRYIKLLKQQGKLEKESERLRKQVESLETTSNATSHYNAFLESKISTLEKENEELKRERDSWKSSTCSYMNKDSLLSMDCQIVREALWELEKEIEFGSKTEDLFFDLKEKFEKLDNHRMGVF